jgi:peroxiredoxin Q/BCP
MVNSKALSAGLVALVALVGCASQQQFSPLEMEQAASARSEFAGLEAPPFELQDQSEQSVSLESMRGKWLVLYFYPRDDTPGCSCQATEFTDLLLEFRNMNAEILGVSADSPASHRIFIIKYDLKLTLLSDPDHAVMERYGSWVTSSLGSRKFGRVIRSTFIIGPDGVIRHHWPEVIPQGHAERVRQKLAELQRGE